MFSNKLKKLEKGIIEIVYTVIENHFDNKPSEENIKEIEKVINSKLYFNIDPKYTFEIELNYKNNGILIESIKISDRKTGKRLN